MGVEINGTMPEMSETATISRIDDDGESVRATILDGEWAPHFAGRKENESTIWDQTSRYTPGTSPLARAALKRE
jgi:hypothetical protein